MNDQNFRVTPDLYASKGNRFANYIIDKLFFYAIILAVSFLIGVIVYSFFTDTTAFDELLTDIENMNPLMDRLLTRDIIYCFIYDY